VCYTEEIFGYLQVNISVDPIKNLSWFDIIIFFFLNLIPKNNLVQLFSGRTENIFSVVSIEQHQENLC
jgi:hypothetical protein